MADKNKEIVESFISLVRKNKGEIEALTKNITVIKEITDNFTEEQRGMLDKLAQEEGSDLEKLGDEYSKAIDELENILK